MFIGLNIYRGMEINFPVTFLDENTLAHVLGTISNLLLESLDISFN